jgi:hypothetical protein
LFSFQLLEVGCWWTNEMRLGALRRPTVVLSLTLLYNVRLEICDVTNKCFLSSFPATHTFLELLAVPFEELVVS